MKDAEVTAYLNGWDDEQKVRYFSDRLKDEAAEWLREYLENEGDVEYSVWKDALISRFRNQADVEHLKHWLQNLKPGTEQRTQSFIARINSIFTDQQKNLKATLRPHRVAMPAMIKPTRY